MNKVLEKQLLAIVMTIKKMQKDIKNNNTLDIDKIINNLKLEYDKKDKKEYETINKELEAIRKQLEAPREQITINEHKDTEKIESLSNSLKIGLDSIEQKLYNFINKEDLDNLIQAVDIKIGSIKIPKVEKNKEPIIKIGKVRTIQAGDDASVDIRKVKGEYILDFNIPRGVSGKGQKGQAGEGIATGGTTGQVLTKNSNNDYDTKWTTASGSGDMIKSVYDPNDVEKDAFDYDNFINTPTIPTKTSDLTNDSNFVKDANYVHTDNNFTTTLKNKLGGIAVGAEVNVQSDWNQTINTADDYIKNKPTIPETSQFVLKTNVLELDNSTEFIPDADYEPATKKYVDDHSSTYTLPIASEITLGGIKVGDNLSIEIDGTLNASGGTGTETDPVFTAWDKDYDDLTNKPTIPTQYTDELAQDAVGGMVDSTLTYTDGTPELKVTNPVTPQTTGFSITAGNTPKTLTVPLDASVSGTNTGDQDLSSKQDLLVSGTNIKTINSTSLLGSGNIDTPNTTYVASDFAHNSLSGLNDGTDYEHITQAQKDALHSAVTVTDSDEIDFTLTGQDITAVLKSGSIDETKLDTSVNASLDKADSALQTTDIINDLTTGGTTDALSAEQGKVLNNNNTTGWVATSGTYASATTITVASGATSIYSKGDKLRLKQGGTYKYFYIIDIADTVLTVTGGSDYTVANATITDMYYSHILNPIGFPSQFNFTLTFSRSGTAFTNPPTSNSAIFKITNSYVTGQVDFTMVANAGGTGEIYSTVPTNIGISAVDMGIEVSATAKLFTLNAAASISRINYYTTNPEGVIPTTKGRRYVGAFRYYI